MNVLMMLQLLTVPYQPLWSKDQKIEHMFYDIFSVVWLFSMKIWLRFSGNPEANTSRFKKWLTPRFSNNFEILA